MSDKKIYLFHSSDAQFSGGAFTNLESAQKWIEKHGLTGVLTAYPINTGAYDWAIEKGYFQPKNEHHVSAKFIGGFTSANQEHYHFENGKNA